MGNVGTEYSRECGPLIKTVGAVIDILTFPAVSQSEGKQQRYTFHCPGPEILINLHDVEIFQFFIVKIFQFF